ncbi:hypothetical protein BPO_0264 [Bergeyella porcorum]|uniref:Glycosyltransferase RgtA/B/C/D-like domain-containing protein n=1 Tax=Bergeyella porcorum TaxID=1735111 RepID=A0AAU0EYT4_9FLAO
MKIFHYLGILSLYFIFVCFVKDSQNNWDKLGYMACVLVLDGQNEVHKKVYSVAEKLDFKEDSPYRKEMRLNEKAFNEQINFYHSRIAYTFTAWIFYKITNDLNVATYILSVLFSLLSLLLLFHILSKTIGKIHIISLTMLPLLFLFKDLIRYTTPDAMSLFFLMLSGWFYWTQRKTLFAFSVFISILVRPDNVLFAVILVSCDFILAQPYRLKNFIISFSQIFVLMLIYWGINTIYDAPKLGTLLCHTFIDKQYFPISSPPLFGYENYIQILLQKGRYNVDDLGIRLLLILVAFFIIFRNQWILKNRLSVLLLSVFVCIVAKFLLFPEVLERHFIFYDLVIIVILSCLTVDLLKKTIRKTSG